MMFKKDELKKQKTLKEAMNIIPNIKEFWNSDRVVKYVSELLIKFTGLTGVVDTISDKYIVGEIDNNDSKDNLVIKMDDESLLINFTKNNKHYEEIMCINKKDGIVQITKNIKEIAHDNLKDIDYQIVNQSIETFDVETKIFMSREQHIFNKGSISYGGDVIPVVSDQFYNYEENQELTNIENVLLIKHSKKYQYLKSDNFNKYYVQNGGIAGIYDERKLEKSVCLIEINESQYVEIYNEHVKKNDISNKVK